MRALGLALIASIVFAASISADIVVLSSGERMDVESYEITKSAVVVKTWDGRLRSLPIAYVDIEATESANAGARDDEKIAPERLEKARRACEAFGIRSVKRAPTTSSTTSPTGRPPTANGPSI